MVVAIFRAGICQYLYKKSHQIKLYTTRNIHRIYTKLYRVFAKRPKDVISVQTQADYFLKIIVKSNRVFEPNTSIIKKTDDDGQIFEIIV